MCELSLGAAIEKLEVKEGDVLVVRLKYEVTDFHIGRIQQRIQNVIYPVPVKVLVLTDGAELSVIRKET